MVILFHSPWFILAKLEAPVEDRKERWQELCALASREVDPDKLFALTQEINRLLEEKEVRLRGKLRSEVRPDQ